MSGENFPNNVAPGTESGENPALEADANAFLAAAGYDERGLNPAEEEANKREWQEMGLEKDVNNASREIAEKAYDNMAGSDSATPEGREDNIDIVENQVKEMAPKIAEEAYDIMSAPEASMDEPESLGDQNLINNENAKTGTDDNNNQ